MRIYKGDMFYTDLTPVVGCEQGGIRPVLIIQNDIGNCYSPTVIVAAITSRTEKTCLPTHIRLCSQQYGLRQNSLVLLEQVRTIDRSRLREYIGHLSELQMRQVNEALAVSFDLDAPLPEPQIEPMAIASPSM
ncbi:type II toxin-antitoxin system PemK/MazF family toxin [Faecalispora jeddahensis]|jgi:mRNA interferase MazF|uniref:type II toxin-antitoxin system PemK/MazF family toxin n=1 Tax=Faecalispora jeddahensis TaxID=1414721 RepID=UPI0018973892|nr:type II toxin-antitoxin system PemK/MazF family toxin [Faecalispora jeddahensis]